ncbi:hypothetical protein A6R68_02894 [Neotoma lepida]|uniref:WW-binding domain-containing protein n=1 Tax=Neotoma lepida TaxID=56216 RepID=A0A1A6GTA4_NEOLE|nr:hypothetical protein A6R68_02894 [Neotoma lepida]
MLTPLGRLDKYAASENIFNRQMVARSLLDTLREVCDDEGDCVAVLERIGRLADDSGRVWMCIYCECGERPFDYAGYVRKTSQAALLALLEQELIERFDVETKVCPVLIELTAPDSNDDVKTEAVAIMCKMAPMVGKDITERLILPRFCEMCCDCRMFHVRKVCAANFGDICSVVGQQATEEMLLPRFFQLCSDNVWGVRKACAECFMAVSCATCQEIRRTKLSALFINLISDPSRWVRQAAFQSLGPFISTFANPSSSGQCFREEGKSSEDIPAEDKSRIKDHDAVEEERSQPEDAAADSSARLESALEDCAAETSGNSAGDISVPEDCSSLYTLSSESHQEAASNENDKQPANCKSAFWPEVGTSSSDSTLLDQELFNSFHFWRTPILEIDLDKELQQDSGETLSPERTGDAPGVPGPGSPNITMATRKELEDMIENLEPHMDDPDVKAQVEVLSAALRASSLDAHEEARGGEHRREPQDELGVSELPDCNADEDASVPFISAAEENMDATPHYVHGGADVIASGGFSPDEERRPKVQDVVPQALLDQYLSMTDPSRAQTVDTEIAKHCAYSLPGVALTLGRQNWHCLRETYETLASDMQGTSAFVSVI